MYTVEISRFQMHSSSTHIDYPFILLSQRRNTLEADVFGTCRTNIHQSDGRVWSAPLH